MNTEVLACDVIEFERCIAADDLESATRLYTGPFLDGVFLKNAPEFERWVDQERSRLEHVQCDALERLATRATAARDHVSAARFWRQRASLTPSDSRGARELMAALVASGDPAGALAHYRAHHALLRDDLGLEPDAIARGVRCGRVGTGRRACPPRYALRARSDHCVPHRPHGPPNGRRTNPRPTLYRRRETEPGAAASRCGADPGGRTRRDMDRERAGNSTSARRNRRRTTASASAL